MIPSFSSWNLEPEDRFEMETITANQFLEFVKENPGWAKTLTEHTLVIGRVKLEFSDITHLSPLLEFKFCPSENDRRVHDRLDYHVASFDHCLKLKVATGTFNGKVRFHNCGLTEIDPENLIIKIDSTNIRDARAADFSHCMNLKVAQGKFPALVKFDKSAIETIAGPDKFQLAPIHVGPNPPVRACFDKCLEIRRAPQWIMDETLTVQLPRTVREYLVNAKRARTALKQPSIEL